MTNDLRVGEAFGREKLVEQNKLFATYYDDIFLRLFGLDCISISPEDLTTVHATLEVEMTMTRTTIRRVFPHLQDSVALKWKLLGLRLCCPASATFQFDKTQFITSVDWTIDFLTGFSGLLTIEEVVLVLQNARIAYNAYLDPGNHDADLDWPMEEAIEQQGGAIDDLTRVTSEPSPWQSECEWRNDYTGAIMFRDGQGDDFVMV
ncbi:hypothetical protein Poli38472_011791 [Pythium oligandrum]|uniref:Transposase n=1 Tax=Pythium oligandrum TaxID=41045 RepID=A0A8K1C870_PYTOL|nr:hypothetical protein Poli38472_011791 [Pythium oligandrum]|eukprot:TMW58203.1 hypothetical protein Poli38472_011791 [Pythium oligandrum]